MEESFPKGTSPFWNFRIGTITINLLCPNSTGEGQKAMRSVSRNYAHSIDGSEPRWKLNVAQIGLQVSPQYLATEAVWGWQKTSGRTKKKGIMDPGDVLRMSDLSKAWGIQVCLCTGVLLRVPPRQVIAECLEPYMADRYPKPPGWYDIQGELMTALQGPELAKWLQLLPDARQVHVCTIIMEILKQLRYTGVDGDNKFRIGWIHQDSEFECLKLPCTGASSWVKVLSDSSDIATFACVTKHCFETTLHARRCREALPESLSFKTLLLYTEASLVLENCNYGPHSDSASIKDGETYWIGREDLLLLATVQLATDAASTTF